MKRYYLALLAGSLFVSSAAFAAPETFKSETNIRREADGDYKSEVTSDLTDTEGTRRKIETTEKGTTNRKGDTTLAFKTSESTDPKGLMNKKTGKVEVTEKTGKNGEYERDTYSRSVDSAGTKHVKKTQAERDVRSDGTMKETVTEKRINDPKGLMNKETVKTEKIVEENVDGTTTTHVEKKVNGETVQDKNVTR